MYELEHPDHDGFVRRLTKEYLWYREELIQLMLDYGLSFYVEHVKQNGMYRWWPQEVIDLMMLVDQSMDQSIPTVDASEKHLPDFLLRKQ